MYHVLFDNLIYTYVRVTFNLKKKVLEYLMCGDLMNAVSAFTHYTEDHVKAIMFQLIE